MMWCQTLLWKHSKLRLLTSIKEIQQINIEMYEPFTVVGFISSKRKTVNSASELLYIKKVPYLKLVLNRISKMLILHLNQRSCFSSLPQRTCQQPCNGPSRTYLLQPDVGLASPGSPDPPEAGEWQYWHKPPLQAAALSPDEERWDQFGLPTGNDTKNWLPKIRTLQFNGFFFWMDVHTCSSEARAVKREIMSLFTYSSSKTLANSPSLDAAARRTIGVSSEHKVRKCLEITTNIKWNLVRRLKQPPSDSLQANKLRKKDLEEFKNLSTFQEATYWRISALTVLETRG